MKKLFSKFSNFVRFLVDMSGPMARNKSDIYFAHFILLLLTGVLALCILLLFGLVQTKLGWIIMGVTLLMAGVCFLNRLFWLGLSKGFGKIASAIETIKKIEKRVNDET